MPNHKFSKNVNLEKICSVLQQIMMPQTSLAVLIYITSDTSYMLLIKCEAIGT
jgi:hypothetical protein